MDDCIFCRIAAGDIPAEIVYEDDTVVAFDDVAPQAPVHTLVVPRGHYAHLGDDVPAEVIAGLFAAVPRIAELKGLSERGYRMIVNMGPDAMQTVPHLHVHVIGGASMGHGMVRFAGEE